MHFWKRMHSFSQLMQLSWYSLFLSRSWSRGRVTAPIHSRKSHRRRGSVVKTRTNTRDETPRNRILGGYRALLGGLWSWRWVTGDHFQWSLVVRSTSPQEGSCTGRSVVTWCLTYLLGGYVGGAYTVSPRCPGSRVAGADGCLTNCEQWAFSIKAGTVCMLFSLSAGGL